MCQPVLLYGLECLELSTSCMKKLVTTQGNLLKQALGVHKYAKSSPLLQAIDVKSIESCIRQQSATLARRIMSVESPVQSQLQYYISLYLHNGSLIPGTLVNRLVQFELSPVQCACPSCQE